MLKTKSNEKQMNNLAKKLKFDRMEGVPAVGKAGGIALLWQSECNIRVREKEIFYTLCYKQNYCMINGMLLSFKAHPTHRRKLAFWHYLCNIGKKSEGCVDCN